MPANAAVAVPAGYKIKDVSKRSACDCFGRGNDDIECAFELSNNIHGIFVIDSECVWHVRS
jgi:hypothetical protein